MQKVVIHATKTPPENKNNDMGMASWPQFPLHRVFGCNNKSSSATIGITASIHRRPSMDHHGGRRIRTQPSSRYIINTAVFWNHWPNRNWYRIWLFYSVQWNTSEKLSLDMGSVLNSAEYRKYSFLSVCVFELYMYRLSDINWETETQNWSPIVFTKVHTAIFPQSIFWQAREQYYQVGEDSDTARVGERRESIFGCSRYPPERSASCEGKSDVFVRAYKVFCVNLENLLPNGEIRTTFKHIAFGITSKQKCIRSKLYSDCIGRHHRQNSGSSIGRRVSSLAVFDR